MIEIFLILSIGSEILKGTGSSCKEKICWKDMRPTQLPISSLVPISQILFHILPIFCPPAAPKQVLSVSTLTHNLCHIFCCTVAHLNWSPNFVKSFKYFFNWKKRFVLYSSPSYWARASFSGAWTKTKGPLVIDRSNCIQTQNTKKEAFRSSPLNLGGFRWISGCDHENPRSTFCRWPSTKSRESTLAN